MDKTYKQFGLIIGSVLSGTKNPDADFDWDALVPLFEKHNLIPVLNAFIATNNIEFDKSSKIQSKALHLLTVHVNQMHEVESIKNFFEEKGIDSIFLKGSVTCTRYPKNEYRTMGDIDILYKVEQHKELKEALFACGYGGYQEGRKNDTFRKPKHIMLEAHRQLVPSDSSFYNWCSKAWDRCVLCDGFRHAYKMTLEDEIIFNIIHFAIHFLEGGAGARFFCDVFVYKNQDCDWGYVERELDCIGLLEFYKSMAKVVAYWFGGSEASDELCDKVIEYVMNGGVFGSSVNAQALAVEDGGTKYLMRHFFPSYREMCSLYPWLKGKAVLLPFAWIKRGVHTLIHKKGAVKRSINTAQNVDKDKIEEIRSLYDECGLKMKLR